MAEHSQRDDIFAFFIITTVERRAPSRKNVGYVWYIKWLFFKIVFIKNIIIKIK